jgi:steroid delta-isomerase
VFDELERKAVALEYIRRINAGDIDELMKLFADNIRFEDPVGSVPIHGKAAVRLRLTDAINLHVYEEPGDISASHDGRHVAIPVKIVMDNPEDPTGKIMKVNLVSICRLNSSGLIEDARVFWGRTDVAFVDRAAPESASAEGTS